MPRPKDPTPDHKDSVISISNHYMDLINSAKAIDSTALLRIRQYLKPEFPFSDRTTKPQSWWRRVWSAYIKYTAWIVAPLKVETASIALYRLPGILPILWLELIAFVYTIIVFARITEVFIARPSTISQTEAIIFVNVFWVVIILMTPAIYNYGATFVFKKKPGSIWRIIFAAVIFTTIVIMLLFPNYELQMLNLESNSTTISSTLYHYIGSWQSITLTVFVTVVILVPSLIYITLLFVDVVLWLIWAGGSVWTYFMLFHRTHPMQKIQKLIYEEIHRKDDEKTSWKLIECDLKEIDSIQAWAEANREGTEKRLLPTIIFFSLIQLFGWNAISNTVVWQRIMEVWDKFIALMLGNGLSSLGIAVSVVVGCVLAIALAPFIAIGQLFSNILPQSLIIEACIVAKYVREKEVKSTPLFDVNGKIPSRFIDRLAYLLGYVPRERQSPDRTR